MATKLVFPLSAEIVLKGEECCGSATPEWALKDFFSGAKAELCEGKPITQPVREWSMYNIKLKPVILGKKFCDIPHFI